jgi:pimeloyl-ACP methyl ester carboxylesterase
VRTVRFPVGFIVLAWSIGCAGQQHCPESAFFPADLPAGVPAVIFVADGAGDFRAASTSFRKVLNKDGLPGSVQTVVWSHGYLRILKDQLDYAYARAEGCRLAGTILSVQRCHPEAKIYVVGHSAGAVVALAAAEALPPCTLEAMALLAPSVSTFYDVRQALPAIRRHLDVYYSAHDILYLGIGTGIFGTSEGLHAPASGRVGFQVLPAGPADEALIKLRQHEWQRSDLPTGNCGGHYGAYQPGFVREHVLPLLLEN